MVGNMNTKTYTRRSGLAVFSGALALGALPAFPRAQTASSTAAPTAASSAAVPRVHALSLLGEPALPADYTHFPYVNPNAPKGGEVAYAALGSFDNFNPFIIRGSSAGGIGQIWQALLITNADEASTEYADIAEAIEVAPDKTWVAFILRPEAVFHDGHKITSADVVWTFDTLREKGRPNYRLYYADVDRAEADGPQRVVFHLKDPTNRELPLILGQLLVLPKHWWEGRDFEKPLTDAPLGSGAYKVDRFEFGRTVSFRRVPGWWGENLPQNRGRYNFDVIRYEYFRDASVAFEAFKSGQIDIRIENIARNWATAYDFPAVRDGRVVKKEFPHQLPTGMQGFGFNTRREVFKDVRVREALTRMFDFEWMNKNIFYGLYTRTTSYFSNSEFASSGLPSGAELALLEPFRDRLPARLFTEPYTLPVTDGSGNNREQMREALTLLKAAGWEVRERKLVNAAGQQMSFEIVLYDPSFERVSLPYAQSLQRLGIDARVRTVDVAQYQRITDSFDFDMTIILDPQSESPGNEQRDFFGSSRRDEEGSMNLMGVNDPVVDALIEKIIQAPDRAALIAATRAMDRVLLWGFYVVPQYHTRMRLVAVWDRFGWPEQPVRTGIDLDSWWVDAAKAARIDAGRRAP